MIVADGSIDTRKKAEPLEIPACKKLRSSIGTFFDWLLIVLKRKMNGETKFLGTWKIA